MRHRRRRAERGHARDPHPPHRRHRLTWHVGVGEDTGLPADRYDLVTFGSSFATTDRPAALRETARIPAPAGLVRLRVEPPRPHRPVAAAGRRADQGRIPDYGYGVRREDQAPVIEASGLFERPEVLREPVLHRVAVDDWLAARRSHGILERQAGDQFDAILADIDRLVLDLGVDELEIPYVTVGWLAAVRGGEPVDRAAAGRLHGPRAGWAPCCRPGGCRGSARILPAPSLSAVRARRRSCPRSWRDGQPQSCR
ncbi:hypothetical protein [Kutzneria sp. 744]|uniref:hypothetical protein n=1 Tax=Kutzneria sp. (strain 744) TaxID=345341 RepID=UPI0003EEBF70|nr:hypothetical protein [Kutzneria sp. 744]EWM12166.1 hypothetical protein KUTG_02470 [Kutzneria sp. 744]